MKGRINKIARSGMAGRKKDTLLLLLVIMMSFFFTILAIILQGSFEKTRDARRLELYGEWHAAYLDADEQILQLLEQEDQISAIGKSYVFDAGSQIGVIGTYNQELLDMGRINLLEGNYPQNPGEIALESSKVAQMGLSNPIGQQIKVVYEFVLQKASNEDILEHREKVIEEYKKKLKEEGTLPEEGTGRYEDIYGNDFYSDPISAQVREYRHRTIDYEYADNGIVLTLSNLYYINYFKGETPDPEEIREHGVVEESILRVNVPYTISGVISDYSDRWDVGYYSLANAFITEESGLELENLIKNTKLTDNSAFRMSDNLNLFLYSDSLREDLFITLAEKLLTKEEYEQVTGLNDYGELSGAISANNFKFRKNSFAYPVMEGSTEATLLLVILTIIFIATIVSVFQIFLSQIKRRSRKIALLKSIGATNGQIISLMAWEGVYLLICCLPAGTVLGAGVSYLVLLFIRLFKGAEVIFHIDFMLAGFGLLAGIVAVLLGMIVPVVYAAGTPLVGTMTKPPRHNTQKIKKLLQNRKDVEQKRQSFISITLRHISLNKSKTLLNMAISAITISILLSAVFICYLSFADYNKAVAIPDRPDYTLEIPYGLDETYIIHYSNALMKIPGVKQVKAYRRGNNLHLYHENLASDEIVNDFYQLIPDSLASEHFAPGFKDGKARAKLYGDENVDKAMLVNMYGINIKSDLGEAIIKSVTDGKIDKEAFEKGKEIILLLPNYKKEREAGRLSSYSDISKLNYLSRYSRMKWLLEKEAGYKFSLDKRYRDLYERNVTIKPGDYVVISADQEIQIGDSIISKFAPYKVKVAGIISYFPDSNIWPFSDTDESYAVIGSSYAFEMMYLASANAYVGDNYGFIQMLTMFDTKFGNTVFHIYANNGADRIKTDTRMIDFANTVDAKLYNYRENNQMLYRSAMNNALIIGILGFATSIIAIFILFNILTSTARQEKYRIGILQSIGVTGRKLISQQIASGFISSLISIVIAHVIVILVMFLTPFGRVEDASLSTLEYIADVFRRLELYPWLIHFLVCILFTAATVMVYYISSIKVIKQSPVENMRV